MRFVHLHPCRHVSVAQRELCALNEFIAKTELYVWMIMKRKQDKESDMWWIGISYLQHSVRGIVCVCVCCARQIKLGNLFQRTQRVLCGGARWAIISAGKVLNWNKITLRKLLMLVYFIEWSRIVRMSADWWNANNANFLYSFQRDHIVLEPTGSDVVNCVSKGKSQVSEDASQDFYENLIKIQHEKTLETMPGVSFENRFPSHF